MQRTDGIPFVSLPKHLVEVVDDQGVPLAVLPVQEAYAQGLQVKIVLVLVYDQDDRKLFLQKRSDGKRLYPGRWDLSATGHVLAGEALEDAARRELREELGVEAKRLVHRHTVTPTPLTGNAHVSLFSAGRLTAPPRPNPREVSDGMFVDRDELGGLVETCPELLTPGLVYCWEKGFLFPAR